MNEVAVGAVDLGYFESRRECTFGGRGELLDDAADAIGGEFFGSVDASSNARALGPTGVQPLGSSGAIGRPRSTQVRSVDALRPAWPSWMPGTVPCVFRNAVMRRKAATCVSFQMPRS